MGSVLSSTFAAITFALANYGVNLLGDHGAAVRERKKFDLAIETSQKARDKWNQERIETLDFINKEMRKRNASIQYFDDLDKGMLEYYRMTGQKLTPLPPEPKFTDFYHPSEEQKSSELLFTIGGMTLVTYVIFKYMP